MKWLCAFLLASWCFSCGAVPQARSVPPPAKPPASPSKQEPVSSSRVQPEPLPSPEGPNSPNGEPKDWSRSILAGALALFLFGARPRSKKAEKLSQLASSPVSFPSEAAKLLAKSSVARKEMTNLKADLLLVVTKHTLTAAALILIGMLVEQFFDVL